MRMQEPTALVCSLT